jgi:hypothetical protein
MLLETGAAAVLFVATFLAAGRMHPLRLLTGNDVDAAPLERNGARRLVEPRPRLALSLRYLRANRHALMRVLVFIGDATQTMQPRYSSADFRRSARRG